MINPFKELNWKPDADELRKFAVSLVIGFPVIAVILFLLGWLFGGHLPKPGFFLWLGGIGSGIGLLCLLLRPVAKPFYYVWFALAACIGIVVSNLLFTLLYYVLFTPIGLFMRLIGRDALSLKRRPDSLSYWKDAPATHPAERYFRQY